MAKTPRTRAPRAPKVKPVNSEVVPFDEEDAPIVSAAAERRQRLKEIRTRLRASGQKGRGR